MHGDCFFRCCLLSAVVYNKMANIWPYLAHCLLDFNQVWIIDEIRNASYGTCSYVHRVKSHIPSSKVIRGQVVRQADKISTHLERSQT